MDQVRILVVCLGNICRSPLGEGLIGHRAAERGLAGHILADSAGTGGWHLGDPPDHRSIRVASRHGLDISRQRARQVQRADFDRFDLILGMDSNNLRDLKRMAPAGCRAGIDLFMAYGTGQRTDVPDPYTGNLDDFEAVYSMLLIGSDAVLDRLVAERSPIGNTSSVT